MAANRQASISRPPLRGDQPLRAVGEDCIDIIQMLDEISDIVLKQPPPLVLGVHGDWGVGKTSFLNLLRHRVETAQNPVVFFEAWKYQHEKAPIVALLHEIRSHLSTSRAIWRGLRKEGEIAVRSALVALEDITKRIGIQASKIEKIGKEWEQQHLASALPSEVIRNLLDKAISGVVCRGKKNGRRLVIIIDDLDRCEPQTAFGLLEGIKIYLNIDSCISVLGLNEREIHRAIAKILPSQEVTGDSTSDSTRSHQNELDIRAREYLEKLCECIRHLPLPGRGAETKMLRKWVADGTLLTAPLLELLNQHAPCLPANPRRIKAYCNAVNHFLYAYQTKEALQEVDLGLAAKIVAVVAYLQLFHNPLHRILQREPGFYEQIFRWASGDDAAEPWKVLERIDLPYRRFPRPADATIADANKSMPKYLDPAFGNTLHLQRVIVASGSFDVNSLKPFLHL